MSREASGLQESCPALQGHMKKKFQRKKLKIKNEHFPPCRNSTYPLKYGFKDGVGGGSYDALILMPFFSMI